MEKFPLIAAAAVSHPRPLVFAVALTLVALGGAESLAATQGPAPAPQPEINYCLQVKNSAARETCQSARKQFQDRNFRASLVTMRKALAISPKDGITRGMLARILMRFDDTGAAERELRQARKDGAPDHFVLPTLFQAMIARHEEISLLNEFPEPAAKDKSAVATDILEGRAAAFLSLGRLDEAAAAMDRTLTLDRNSDGLLIRAKIATQQNDLSLAGKLVDEAYRLDPRSGAVLYAKLHQSELSNDTAKTLALSDEMLKLYPYNINARESRIRVFLKQNQDAKAKVEVDALLAKSSKSFVGLFYKAVLLSRANNKMSAAQVIQSLPAAFVKSRPEFAVQMAQIVFDNGNVETGAAILGAALSTAPDLLDVRLQLASLRLSQNSPQSAMGLLSPVKDDHDPRVQKLLAQVRARIAKDRAF